MRLCIATPNKFSYSETFIRNHIEQLKPEYYVNNGWLPTSVSNGEKIFKGLMRIELLRAAIKRATPKIYQQLHTKAFHKFIVLNKIDTILAEYGIMGVTLMNACKETNCKLVVHYHGFDAFDKKTLKLYSDRYKEMFEYAHHIIAVSIDMKNQLLKMGAPESKLLINSYGVDINKFLRSTDLPLNPIIIAVGRFTAKKSPQTTITAFSKVLKTIPTARLVMIGDGELFQDAQNLAHELNIFDKIDFKGVLPPDKIINELCKARLFVQHSVIAPSGDSEGLPNSILEAASIGLPVVSTFHAGIPEAVRDKQTGFLVKEHDIDGMAGYMIELLTNDELAVSMGKNARKHIENNYSLEGKKKTLLNILTA